jgi:benzil reductase ((S)-benzoin forming)
MDQWVRTAGAEQERRGGRCRVLAVAPGVIATDMQRQIRSMSEVDFPEVEHFRTLASEGALRPPADVARDLWGLLSRNLENGAVVDLRDVLGD